MQKTAPIWSRRTHTNDKVHNTRLKLRNFWWRQQTIRTEIPKVKMIRMDLFYHSFAIVPNLSKLLRTCRNSLETILSSTLPHFNYIYTIRSMIVVAIIGFLLIFFLHHPWKTINKQLNIENYTNSMPDDCGLEENCKLCDFFPFRHRIDCIL